MKTGKVPETVLKRSVLNQINRRRAEVLVGPSVGEDCSVMELEEDEVLVISTDPITGTVHEIGSLAVHITANDIASSGAEIIGIMLNVLLPVDTEEHELKAIMRDIDKVCDKLDIEIMGGHTEVTQAVNQVIITVTGVGKTKKTELVNTSGARPGDSIIVTKWVGLEGTAIIAVDKKTELLTRYSNSFVDSAIKLLDEISVIPEAKISKEVGVSSMHDITEGGIFGALWEIGVASGVGLEVDINKIPIRQETVEICEFYELNPYKLMSSGCMLIVTDKANQLINKLKKANIPAEIIGVIKEGNKRTVINGEERRFLEPPRSDELYKVL
ncbi:MAG TPA: hydrogenase maturation factor [Clostridiales bacterium]|nr:hydrogenase maturation factor [Clostridiales bacterium]